MLKQKYSLFNVFLLFYIISITACQETIQVEIFNYSKEDLTISICIDTIYFDGRNDIAIDSSYLPINEYLYDLLKYEVKEIGKEYDYYEDTPFIQYNLKACGQEILLPKGHRVGLFDQNDLFDWRYIKRISIRNENEIIFDQIENIENKFECIGKYSPSKSYILKIK